LESTGVEATIKASIDAEAFSYVKGDNYDNQELILMNVSYECLSEMIKEINFSLLSSKISFMNHDYITVKKITNIASNHNLLFLSREEVNYVSIPHIIFGNVYFIFIFIMFFIQQFAIFYILIKRKRKELIISSIFGAGNKRLIIKLLCIIFMILTIPVILSL